MGRVASPPVSNARELALYFGLAYGISLLLWLAALQGKIPLAAGTFGPTLAAIIAQRVSAGNWRAVRLWTCLPRILLGIAAGGGAVLIAAFSAAFLMTRSGLDRWQWSALLQIVTLFGPNLLGGPLGEEAGWRGYALPRLQQRFTPVISSLLLGFLWANWHLPLMLAHVYNVTWWQFVLLTMAASVFLSFGFNLSQGSTIAAILIHGLYNIGTGVILNDFVLRGRNASSFRIDGPQGDTGTPLNAYRSSGQPLLPVVAPIRAATVRERGANCILNSAVAGEARLHSHW